MSNINKVGIPKYELNGKYKILFKSLLITGSCAILLATVVISFMFVDVVDDASVGVFGSPVVSSSTSVSL